MSTVRIALANLEYPATPDQSIAVVERAIADAAGAGAAIVCFPEAYVPGYRGLGHTPPPPDPVFLERAWSRIAAAAARAGIVVVLGTERIDAGRLLMTVLVIDRDGTRLGFQDKNQIDPTEEGIYQAGAGNRRVFQAGALTFGVAICHEGFRYPETVRWAVVNGAQLVFHPHLHEANDNGFTPTTYGDPRNSFHEKAALCRAAENTCFYATVNYASAGSATTSAIISPDGSVQAYQPYGQPGLLIADIDLRQATRLLASRLRTAAIV